MVCGNTICTCISTCQVEFLYRTVLLYSISLRLISSKKNCPAFKLLAGHKVVNQLGLLLYLSEFFVVVCLNVSASLVLSSSGD